MSEFDMSVRRREHEAKRDYVLVRGSSPFSYYGQRWDGEWKLCKDIERASPVLREDGEKLRNANVNALAYIEPITHQHAAHLARCHP